MGPARAILHVDMNAYFASVEQAANPALRGRPVVVVGGLERRSIVLTASYEARPFGVKTGMPLHEARALCPGLMAVEGHHADYGAVSARLKTIFLGFTDRVEMTSCDEAFLDVSRPAGVDAEAEARAVQAAVRAGTGLPCSVGAAPNKCLAKLASEMRKPNGVTVIEPDAVGEVLDRTPVENLCGVGERLRRALEPLGVRTAGDLGRLPPENLYARFGVTGHWLSRMGRGLDDSPVLRPEEESPPKSVGHATTFPKNTRDPELLRAYLLYLCEKVGRRLRRAGLRGRVVSLGVRFGDFSSAHRQSDRRAPIDDDGLIFRAAEGMLSAWEPVPRPVRLLSVTVSRLSADDGQRDFLEDVRRPALSRVMDRLNAKYGAHALRHARVDLARRAGISKPPTPPRGVVEW